MDDAVGKAREARERAAAGGPPPLGKMPKPGDMPDISNLSRTQAKVSGTFSAYAARRLGGPDDTQKKMENHLFKIVVVQTTLVDQTAELVDNTSGGGIFIS